MATNSPIELLITMGIDSELSRRNIQSTLDKLKSNLTLDIVINPASDNAFKGMNQQISNLQQQTEKLNQILANLGNTGKRPKSENMTVLRQEILSNIKSLEDLQKYMNASGMKYSLTFDKKNNIKNIITEVKNELGEVSKVTIKPIIDKNGVTSFQQEMQKITNTDTHKLNENIRKAVSDLDKLAIQGKLSAEQLSLLKNAMNNSRTNQELQQIVETLKSLHTQSSHAGKFSSTMDNLNGVFVKLKNNAQMSTIEIDKLAQKMSNIKSGDIAGANKLLTEMRNRLKEVNQASNFSDGVNAYRNSLKRLESELIKIQKINKRTFDREHAARLAQEIDRLKSKNLLDNRALKASQQESRNLTEGVKRFGAEASTASRNSMGLIESFKTAMTKFPVWMGASTLFFGITRSITDLKDRVIELDSAVVNLRRVMDVPEVEFNTVIERAIENVTELSGKTMDYMKLVADFGRTGLSMDESIDMADTATLLQNISELTADESFDSLTAAMISYNIAAEDSIQIANKLNEVDNNYAITTRDLGLSLNKASSTAKTFGVSLDELLGYTTAIGSATRESG